MFGLVETQFFGFNGFGFYVKTQTCTQKPNPNFFGNEFSERKKTKR